MLLWKQRWITFFLGKLHHGMHASRGFELLRWELVVYVWWSECQLSLPDKRICILPFVSWANMLSTDHTVASLNVYCRKLVSSVK